MSAVEPTGPAAAADEKAAPDGRPLGTVSIRVRVIAAVMVVLALVLLVLSFSVQAVFDAQTDRDVDALLSGRTQLARQLARSGVRPQQVVNRVAVDGVVASLELRDGTVLGTTVPAGSGVRTETARLAGSGRIDGSTLTLGVNSSLVEGSRQSLRRILLVGGLAALVLAAVLVAVAVRLALHPLDAMAALAQSIAAGARGRRLSPTRADTEVGRTAAAFDEMLDELEGAEARARTAQAQALAAERRTRAFLADAAHELRTPLAGVQAAAETLLQHRDALRREDRDRLEVLLVGEVRRAGRLVENLLTMARLDAELPVTLAPVDLRALVDAEVARARLLAPGTQVDVEVATDGHGPVVPGDATALQGLVRNLLDNALRAAGPQGTVRVLTSATKDRAVVHVRDDGPGVPLAERERVFDRLVRLDPARGVDSGGSGLGLTIARATARAHGGDLVCLEVPPPARGADFRLTLPLTSPETARR